ncbi:hypothetical protein D3C81_2199210 [compost metagenome]
MYTSGVSGWNWLIDTLRDSSQKGQTATGWNDDFMLVGHVYRSWVYRGGTFGDNTYAGVFAANVDPRISLS